MAIQQLKELTGYINQSGSLLPGDVGFRFFIRFNREAVENYSTELLKVSEELFGNLSLLMGMEKDSPKQLYEEMTQAIRMNYYPTCSRPDLVLGVSPHSDASAITLLLQDDEITGLQIRQKGGWIPVKPIPNAIVVNLDDVCEAWSNGVYKSIEHRAVTNERRARMSLATFVLPSDKADYVYWNQWWINIAPPGYTKGLSILITLDTLWRGKWTASTHWLSEAGR